MEIKNKIESQSDDVELEESYYSDDSDTEIEYQECTGLKYTTTITNRIKMRQEGRQFYQKNKKDIYLKFKSHAVPKSSNNEYVVLFRGIRFSPNFFTNKDRRRICLLPEQSADIAGKTEYSSACFRNANFNEGIALGKYMSGRMTEEEQRELETAKTHTANFIDFLYKRTDLKTKVNSKYLYESLLFAILNANTNNYAKMDSIMEKLVLSLKKYQKKLKLTDKDIRTILDAYIDFGTEKRVFDRKSFISTSLRAEIGIGYTLPYIEEENVKGFDPEYDKTGKPKHRHGGIVEVIFVPANEYVEETKKTGRMIQNDDNTFKFVEPKNVDINTRLQFVDLHYARHIGLMRPDIRILEQFEANFMNTIDGKYVVASFPIYYPNFGKKYKPEYKTNYGLDEKTFKNIKEKLASGEKENYNQAIIDLSEILKKHYTELLEKFVSNIINNYEHDGQKTSLFRVLPKIKDGEISTTRAARSCTIDRRYEVKSEKKNIMQQNEKLKTFIALNTAKCTFGIPRT